MRTIAMHPVSHLFLTSALCALRIWRCDSIYVETLDGVDIIFKRTQRAARQQHLLCRARHNKCNADSPIMPRGWPPTRFQARQPHFRACGRGIILLDFPDWHHARKGVIKCQILFSHRKAARGPSCLTPLMQRHFSNIFVRSDTPKILCEKSGLLRRVLSGGPDIERLPLERFMNLTLPRSRRDLLEEESAVSILPSRFGSMHHTFVSAKTIPSHAFLKAPQDFLQRVCARCRTMPFEF